MEFEIHHSGRNLEFDFVVEGLEERNYLGKAQNQKRTLTVGRREG